MSASSALQLSFELGSVLPEEAEAACFACGAQAVTYSDAADHPVLEPAPGEFRLWPATRLQALFAATAQATPLITDLSRQLGIPREAIQCETLEQRPWERAWLKDFHAMRFGERLWVCPSHQQVNSSGAAVVHLDPGLAFGTGTHPSTALCLEWLAQHLHPDCRVIDYGCGSGILALAALALGASSAECFDIDPQALMATQDNAARNGVASRVRIVSSATALAAGADVLVANILAGPLCDLAAEFARLVRAHGDLVLAGLMEQQATEVTEAYRACFDMRAFGHREGWIALHGRRR